MFTKRALKEYALLHSCLGPLENPHYWASLHTCGVGHLRLMKLDNMVTTGKFSIQTDQGFSIFFVCIFIFIIAEGVLAFGLE